MTKEIDAFWDNRFKKDWDIKKHPIPEIEIREPYYEWECSNCTHTGSSETWFSTYDSYAGDGGMLCPMCLNED